MYIYKLDFLSPVRFGKDDHHSGLVESAYTCHCDTLYSAIAFEIRRIFGRETLESFITYSKSDGFNISDLFPYLYDDLFLPKPFIYVEAEQQSGDREQYLKRRKELKKLRYINVNEWDEFVSNFKKGVLGDYDDPDIAAEHVRTNAAISRAGTDTVPYYVSCCQFYEGTGLYFVLQCEDEQNKKTVDSAMESLSYTGIGGKKTSGFGKFSFTASPLEPGDVLHDLLTRQSSKYMLISLLHPKAEDIRGIKETGSYQIIRRGGFIYSDDHGDEMVKKNDLHVFNSGSCFGEKYHGEVASVSNGGSHPVYRYAKGFYMGVLPW